MPTQTKRPAGPISVAANAKKIKTLQEKVKKLPEPEKRYHENAYSHLCSITNQSTMYHLFPQKNSVDGNSVKLTGLYGKLWCSYDATRMWAGANTPSNAQRYIIYYDKDPNRDGTASPAFPISAPYGMLDQSRFQVLYDRTVDGRELSPVYEIKLDLKNRTFSRDSQGFPARGALFLQVICYQDETEEPFQTHWVSRTYYTDA